MSEHHQQPKPSQETPAVPPADDADIAAPGATELAGAAAGPNLETLLAEAQQRVDAQREATLRALADAENARKRAQVEIASAHKFALEKFAQALLPVVDSLEAGLGAENASVDALKSGAELTLKQLRAALGRENVVEIAPAQGERFDPHWHQAMAAVEVANAEPNTVVAVMQKGWRLHDRVLRPALVTVAKAAPANDA